MINIIKILLVGLILICNIANAQKDSKNYGIRYIELGRDVKDMWKDYNADKIARGGYEQAFGLNCTPSSVNYDNHKVVNCYFLAINLLDEVHDLEFITDNDVVIEIRYPDKFPAKLQNKTSYDFVNETINALSKKHSQEPLVTSKPLRLNDNFDDEEQEFNISCRKVLSAAYPGTTSDQKFQLRGIVREACTLKFDRNNAPNLSQFPVLSSKRDEILNQIKLANSKKGADCKNCNAKLYIAQWGETGSGNVLQLIYTKRDLTGAYRFVGLKAINQSASIELNNIKNNMIKNIESNVFKGK